MEQHLKLFTPVSEGLPEKEIEVLCIDRKGDVRVDIIIESPTRFIDLYTHWLDLSKLTTIEAAKELIGLAFSEGEECYRTGMTIEKFITENL